MNEADWRTACLDACRQREEFRAALVACVAVAKAWHGTDVWDLYYNHSPEMKPIRDLLGLIE